MSRVDIVDERDNVIGCEEKFAAHEGGLLHRMSRIFLIDSQNKLLLQKRTANKDVFPNCWDQSVGGHVDTGEDYLTAAKRELGEELGLAGLELKEVGKYYNEETYKGNELRHFNVLYTAHYSTGLIRISQEEISKVEWFSVPQIEKWIKLKPEDFSAGFPVTFQFYNERRIS